MSKKLLAIALLLVAPLCSLAQTSEPVASTLPERIAVLVELTEPPAAEVYASAMEVGGAQQPGPGGRRVQTDAARMRAVDAARVQFQRNRAEQARLRPLLLANAPAATLLYEVQHVANAVALEVDRDALEALRRTRGVRRVTIIEPEFPHTSTSVPHLDTIPVWSNAIGRNLAVDGSGVTIGVIDTGVDYQHATFGGTGLQADYLANDRTVAPDAFYPTAKVTGGYDFAGDGYNGTAATIAPDSDPMDCNGHGTHVASIAGGFGVTAAGLPFGGPFDATIPFSSLRIGPGTAPRADIYALRVFGCGGSTNLTVQAIEHAVDPDGDGDVSDRLDIINMSLGSSFGRLASTSSIAADNAAKFGVVVVASAGNSGDTFLISGSPGAGKRVISTAGTQDPGLAGNVIRVNSPTGIAGVYTAAASAFGPAPAGSLTGNLVAAVDAADAAGPLTTDACSPLTNAAAIAGNIALVDRGTCGFAVKVKNAQDAGAIAVVIGNSAAAFGTPGGVDPTITIPSAMITFADAGTIRANLGSGVNVTFYDASNILYGSTSRGTRGGPLGGLKPDIAAPGQSIAAAQTGITCTGVAPSSGCQAASPTGIISDSQALVLSGTSMAAPHMAGIMALLRQLHPTWSVEELKAAAMNRAHHDVTTVSGGTTRYAPGRVGAGRVDATLAATTDVVAFDDEESGVVSLSFELGGVVGSSTQTRRLRIVNRNASDVTYDLDVDSVSDAPGVLLSFPGGSEVTVPANDSVTVDVVVNADAAQMDHVREASVSATQTAPASPASVATLGTMNRHWITEESGYLTLSESGTLRLRVPFVVSAQPASAMTAADELVTGGSPTGSITIPLSGSDVCTGTPGAGPTCTGSFPTDEVSLVTPFELQVASAMNPLAAPGFADLQYAGVAYSPATDQLFFGLSMWEPWATPTDVSVNIRVDCGVYTNVGAGFSTDTCTGAPDGIWDLVLFNTNPGSLANLFGASAAQSDTFITAVFVRTRSSVVFGPANYVNRLSAGAADTRVFDNQVMFLASDRSRLKINPATGAFAYSIETCPGSAPLCRDLNGFAYDSETGPFRWNYLAANQGLDFGGGNLFFDLNGASIPVTWNVANVTANGSLGGLLLHHHNARGRRAEVFTLPGAPRADIGVGLSLSDASPSYGDTVTLAVAVQNNGPDASHPDVAVQIPSGLTYVSNDSGGTFNTSLNVWDPGVLASGATATLAITLRVDTTDPSVVRAIASVTTPLDQNPANNEAVIALATGRTTDVELSMSVDAPTAIAGSPVTYTITARNAGDESAYSVMVDESFAAFPALDPTSFTASRGSYNPASGIWNLAGLTSGSTETLELTFTAPPMIGALTNQANAGSTTSDADGANNTASATAMILAPSSVTGGVTLTTARRHGDTVMWEITLTNGAGTPQVDNPGAEATFTLPAVVTFTGASATSGIATDDGTGLVSWNGSIAGNGSVVITVSGTLQTSAVPGSSVGATAAASYDSDGNGTNETNVVLAVPTFVVLSPASLTAVKTVDVAAYPGGHANYMIVVSNGSDWAQVDNPGDELTDVVPASLVPGTVSATSGTATLSGNTVTWNGSVDPHGSVTITIPTTIAPDAPVGVALINQAALSYDGDGDLANESSALSNESTFILASPASITPLLGISGSGIPGSTMTFSVTLSNAGPAAQLDNPGDELVVPLPASLTLVSASASGGSAVVDGNVVRWNGAIAPSGSVVVTFTATLDPTTATASTIEITASASYDADGDGANETSADSLASFVVLSPASLSAPVKSVSGPTHAGATVTYTIVLSNSGAAPQLDNAGPEMADVLPTGVTLLGASATSGTALADIASNTVTWNGSIAPSATVTITITASVAPAAAGTVVANQATINYDEDGNGTNEATSLTDDPSTGVAGDATSFTVTSPASFAQPAKSVSGTFEPGSTVTYSIVLTNTGAATQLDNAGDELVDVLPDALSLISASASSGTSVATVATNTVAWNGTIAAGASVTVTIQATVDSDNALGTMIANQATLNYDSDGNGTNDASAQTNDPSTGAAGDATAFAVASPAMIATATKSVTGSTLPGATVTYTITFRNDGLPQFDNPGDELVDVLPASLTPASASASAGTAMIAGNTVTWNGSIATGETITVTIEAVIAADAAAGTAIDNAATVNFDADGNGTNESTIGTNPASFVVGAAPAEIVAIPSLSPLGLILLASILGFAALIAVKR